MLPSQGLPPVQSGYLDFIERVLGNGEFIEAERPLNVESRTQNPDYVDKTDTTNPPLGPNAPQGPAGPSELGGPAKRRSARLAEVAKAKDEVLEAQIETAAKQAIRDTKIHARKEVAKKVTSSARKKIIARAKEKIESLKEVVKAPRGEVDYIKPIIGSPALNAIYRHASQSLFPLFMVPPSAFKTEAGTAGLSFDVFFTRKLTDICNRVWGDMVTSAIREKSKEKDLRNFFEIMDAGPQCDAVIGPYDRQTGQTMCWICKVPVGKGKDDKETFGYPECEHLLPVLWALLVSGLYDKSFEATLTDPEKQSYRALLKREYAWAHSRCNQIKSHTVYLGANIEKTGRGTGVAKFYANTTNIQQNLETIIDKPYTHYRPTHTKLQELVGDRNRWLPERIAGIAQIMTQNFITKLNQSNIPVGTIVSRFTTGLLDRAVLLAGDRVRNILANKNAVDPTQYENFKKTFARLNKPPLAAGERRRTHRKNQRGGISFRGRVQRVTEEDLANDPSIASLADFAESTVKAMCIHALRESIFAAKTEGLLLGRWPISQELETEIQHVFVEGTDALAISALEAVFDLEVFPETPDAFSRAFVDAADILAEAGRDNQKDRQEIPAHHKWLRYYKRTRAPLGEAQGAWWEPEGAKPKEQAAPVVEEDGAAANAGLVVNTSSSKTMSGPGTPDGPGTPAVFSPMARAQGVGLGLAATSSATTVVDASPTAVNVSGPQALTFSRRTSEASNFSGPAVAPEPSGAVQGTGALTTRERPLAPPSVSSSSAPISRSSSVTSIASAALPAPGGLDAIGETSEPPSRANTGGPAPRGGFRLGPKPDWL
jgi:hypothetical protein